MFSGSAANPGPSSRLFQIANFSSAEVLSLKKRLSNSEFGSEDEPKSESEDKSEDESEDESSSLTLFQNLQASGIKLYNSSAFSATQHPAIVVHLESL